MEVCSVYTENFEINSSARHCSIFIFTNILCSWMSSRGCQFSVNLRSGIWGRGLLQLESFGIGVGAVPFEGPKKGRLRKAELTEYKKAFSLVWRLNFFIFSSVVEPLRFARNGSIHGLSELFLVCENRLPPNVQAVLNIESNPSRPMINGLKWFCT